MDAPLAEQRAVLDLRELDLRADDRHHSPGVPGLDAPDVRGASAFDPARVGRLTTTAGVRTVHWVLACRALRVRPLGYRSWDPDLHWPRARSCSRNRCWAACITSIGLQWRQRVHSQSEPPEVKRSQRAISLSESYGAPPDCISAEHSRPFASFGTRSELEGSARAICRGGGARSGDVASVMGSSYPCRQRQAVGKLHRDQPGSRMKDPVQLTARRMTIEGVS